TILTVLQHYYRRPGPERVIAASLNPFLPDMWKQYHSCSDVLRARNNGLWYMELLENCRVYSFHPQERSLLALAIMYHDAATVDVDKPAAITKSAEYFKRDLAEHFPEQLLNDMALAMVSMANEVNGKADQNLSESVRWYLRVLRFAVRMDRIRLKADFPGLAVTQHKNPAYLDLPTQLVSHFSSDPDHKTEFQRHLEAAMHGAADLVQVTNDSTDKRDNPYTQVFALAPDVEIITRQFDRTAEPLQRMDQFINDNVRREIAQMAGIITCSDPDHQACKADRSKGITYGIHNSWYDLQQVAVPAGMTPLEKMQYRHDPSLLSPATQQALAEEVQRLKSKGIQMNPGTLTQETLATREARKVLKERGITVVSEKRTVCTDNGKLRKWPMLVPKKIA
ncbi:hypothetical protein, partial [Endozoicomonas sp. ONNA2]|uniref:hypothetical protein n=1 Tax=Endozoicomonas sp. ONNA2 TaxID=2828741 RepID=UPI0021480185